MSQTNQQLFANYLNLVEKSKTEKNVLKSRIDGLERQVKVLLKKNEVLKQNNELHKKEKKELYQQLQAK